MQLYKKYMQKEMMNIYKKRVNIQVKYERIFFAVKASVFVSQTNTGKYEQFVDRNSRV